MPGSAIVAGVDLDAAARVLIGNPFAAEPARWRRATERLGEADLARVLPELVRAGRIVDAKRVVLAAGHLAACDHPDEPERVLGDDVLPRSVARALPRSRGAYLRVVMAAGRCRRALGRILGPSTATQRVRRETWAACFGDSLLHTLTLAQVIHDHDVLILGETGTGKEAVALAIQDGTPGGEDGGPAPRSTLNAAAVPETLVESELFGHVKGAFTGATETRRGRIRSADGGCFFLDEVGELDPTTQVKLLRVIETDEVNPVGSDVNHHADVRYVAATHQDLEARVEAGRFRRDFYQRLAGNVIRLPALRERPEDIPEIGLAFVERHLPEDQLPETRERLERWLHGAEAMGYHWPGNVRELQNALRNLLLGLDAGIGPARVAAGGEETARLPAPIREATAPLSAVEDWYVARVLDRTEGNLTRAATVLGVDRTTVRRRARRIEGR